jgi:hypothetical protein
MYKLFLFITFFACAQRPFLLDKSYKDKIFKSLRDGVFHVQNGCLEKNGAAKGDYKMITATWSPYETAWHTGQLINGILQANIILKRKDVLKTAIKSGNWWINLQFKKGKLKGFVNAIHGAEVGNLINTTTISDGTPGMYLLSQVTNDEKYATVATDAGAFIYNNLYLEKEKLSYNIVDPVSGEIWKDKSPHKQHQNKDYNLNYYARANAEGAHFKDMYQFTKDEKYKKAFLNLCDGLVETQSENGFWMNFEPNDAEKGKIHARFNTWNAEALLEAFYLSNNEKYKIAAHKTAVALQKIQQKNGVIYYSSFTNGKFEEESPCGSAVSFAGILWLKLQQLSYEEFNDSIQIALDFTLHNQFPINHPDKNLAGGYFEIRQKIDKDGTVNLIYRDIATAFGLRFMSLIYNQAGFK